MPMQNIMDKFFPKNDKKFQQEKRTFKDPRAGAINKFAGNAARLEHVNVRNKNKGKKG